MHKWQKSFVASTQFSPILAQENYFSVRLSLKQKLFTTNFVDAKSSFPTLFYFSTFLLMFLITFKSMVSMKYCEILYAF